MVRDGSRGHCGTGAGAAVAGGRSISRPPALETLVRRPRAASTQQPWREVKSPVSVSCVCLVVFRSVTSLDMPKAEVKLSSILVCV